MPTWDGLQASDSRQDDNLQIMMFDPDTGKMLRGLLEASETIIELKQLKIREALFHLASGGTSLSIQGDQNEGDTNVLIQGTGDKVGGASQTRDIFGVQRATGIDTFADCLTVAPDGATVVSVAPSAVSDPGLKVSMDLSSQLGQTAPAHHVSFGGSNTLTGTPFGSVVDYGSNTISPSSTTAVSGYQVDLTGATVTMGGIAPSNEAFAGFSADYSGVTFVGTDQGALVGFSVDYTGATLSVGGLAFGMSMVGATNADTGLYIDSNWNKGAQFDSKLNVYDDVALSFGESDDATITYDEAGNDRLQFGGADVELNQNLVFGTTATHDIGVATESAANGYRPNDIHLSNQLLLHNNSESVALQGSGSATGSYTITLPVDAPGGADKYLKFDATGVASFVDEPGGGPAAGTTTDSMLRWSGSAWTEEPDLRLNTSGQLFFYPAGNANYGGYIYSTTDLFAITSRGSPHYNDIQLYATGDGSTCRVRLYQPSTARNRLSFYQSTSERGYLEWYPNTLTLSSTGGALSLTTSSSAITINPGGTSVTNIYDAFFANRVRSSIESSSSSYNLGSTINEFGSAYCQAFRIVDGSSSYVRLDTDGTYNDARIYLGYGNQDQYLVIYKGDTNENFGLKLSELGTEVGQLEFTTGDQMVLETLTGNYDVKISPHGTGDVVIDDSPLIWATDGGADIGASGANRPDVVYVASKVTVDTLSLDTDSLDAGAAFTITTGSGDLTLTPTDDVIISGTVQLRFNSGSGPYFVYETSPSTAISVNGAKFRTGQTGTSDALSLGPNDDALMYGSSGGLILNLGGGTGAGSSSNRFVASYANQPQASSLQTGGYWDWDLQQGGDGDASNPGAVGGRWLVNAGTGGDSANAGQDGGAGGPITLAAGDGGDNTAAGTAGAGADFTIVAGRSGSEGAKADDGDIILSVADGAYVRPVADGQGSLGSGTYRWGSGLFENLDVESNLTTDTITDVGTPASPKTLSHRTEMYNSTGTSISQYAAVYLDATSRDGVTTCDPTSQPNFFGITQDAILGGANQGTICYYGYCTAIKGGESWTFGDLLWLDAATAGELTNTKPTGSGDYQVPVGYAMETVSAGSTALVFICGGFAPPVTAP